jgi:PhoPQ-activated pathogenicity-related protein
MAALMAPAMLRLIATAQAPTALDHYIRKADPAYAWKVAKTVDDNQSKTIIVHLTSQTWRTKDEVDRNVWEHWLVIVKPAKPVAQKAFLLVGGGANDRPMPTRADQTAQQIAEATNSVVAELRMIPNQPLIFHNDGKPRKEDDLIAYCWDQYIKTGDATWLPRLPMVKSVVRAMDCIQEVMKTPEGGNFSIDKFVVAGGSKRGWTTWLTGVADPRVEAIVPIVIDVVNVHPSMRHHAAVYGFWAQAVGDYVNHQIMQRWDDPRLQELYRVVDPYYYRDRLTMPKYIVNGSGDQFFCPDSSQFYFDGLKGEKLLRYVPNADHSLRGSDAVASIAAFYQMILDGAPRPKVSWTFEDGGSIRVKSDPAPKQVHLWQATNPKARDFRVSTIGRAYQSRELKSEADGTFVAKVEPPKEGWTAYFVELTYDTGGTAPLKLTTAVRVIPDVLPYASVDPKKIPYEKAPQ